MGITAARSVVVAGVGVVTPAGCDPETLWKRCVRGESAAAALPEGELRETGAAYYCPVRERGFPQHALRHIAFARAAAEAAVADAGLEIAPCRARTGVIIGSSKGGYAALERMCGAFLREGPAGAQGMEWVLRCPAAAVAERVGARGPVLAPGAACATGAYAVLAGMRMILLGDADVVVAGATESCFAPMLLRGYRRMGVLATGGACAGEACRPFAADRSGFVLGEGCGMVVLEEGSHAAARGARVRAELRGGAAGADAHHMTAPEPAGGALALVIAEAMRRARVAPEEVHYLNAHGTGTRHNDPAETRAIKRAFGGAARGLSVSSTKPVTGHLLGAAGIVEFVVALLALERGVAPPTCNLHSPDPACDLDFTPLAARERAIGNVMSVSCGFGGHMAALVAGRPGQ